VQHFDIIPVPLYISLSLGLTICIYPGKQGFATLFPFLRWRI